MPAAKLDAHARRHRLKDGIDRRAIHRAAGKGAVEIDHMQPWKADVVEGARLGGRIGVVDGGGIHVAELQANAGTVLEVDGGIENHGRHLRKLAMRPRPSAWLFSGWNCVPAMLSRPIMAVTGPP